MYEDDGYIKLNRKMRAIASALASVLFLFLGSLLFIMLLANDSVYAFPSLYFMIFVIFAGCAYLYNTIIPMIPASGAAVASISSLVFGLMGNLTLPDKHHIDSQSTGALLIGIVASMVIGALGSVFVIVYRRQFERQ